MMINFIAKNKSKLFIWGMIFLFFIFVRNFSLSRGETISTITIDENITSKFLKNDFVSYIINLNEEANIEDAIETANIVAEKTRATPTKQKSIQRNFVVSQLQSTAETTQEDIINFLEKEKTLGHVTEINSLYILNAIVITSNEKVFQELSKSKEIKEIYLNEEVNIDFDDKNDDILNATDDNISNFASKTLWNLEQINADKVWKEGYLGNGITVAIIDTGVDGNHPSLKNSWRGNNSPSSYGHWYDVVDKTSTFPYDAVGHGTHVAGIITGLDEKENIQTGVAPKANWIGVKAFDSERTTTEMLLEASQWVLAPLDEKGIPQPNLAPDIVNGSWTSANNGINEVFLKVIDKWRSANIIPIFAVGNTKFEGQVATESSVSAPANYPNVFSVGSIDKNNNLESYSLRGPSPYGDIKPEITAPGGSILSAKTGGGYIEKSGSSMAAPHVTGAVALLMEAKPTLTIEEIENLLTSTTTTLTNSEYTSSPNNGFGHGKLNIYNALSTTLSKDYGTIEGYVKINGIDNENPEIIYNHTKEIIKLDNSYLTFNVKDDNGIKDVYIKFREKNSSSWSFEEKLSLSYGSYVDGDYEFLIPNKVFALEDAEYKIIAHDIQDNITESNIESVLFIDGIKPGYVQDFEKNINDFRFYNEGDVVWGWGKTSSPKANSGENVIATALDNNYMGLKSTVMQMPIVDLTKLTSSDKPMITFANWYEFFFNSFGDDDKGLIYVSTINSDNSINSTKELVASFKGYKTYWNFNAIDLSKWCGERISIQFVLESENTRYQTERGWYIDDMKFITNSTYSIDEYEIVTTEKNIDDTNKISSNEKSFDDENNLSSNEKSFDDTNNLSSNEKSFDDTNNLMSNKKLNDPLLENQLNENNKDEVDENIIPDVQNNIDDEIIIDDKKDIVIDYDKKFIINRSGTPERSSSNTLPVTATVTIKETGLSTTTEKGTGFYSLKHAKGNYTLIVEADGLKSHETSVVFEDNVIKTTDINLSEESKGIIKGVIKDAKNNSIKNARVRLLNDASIPLVFTNANGEFAFTDIKVDSYTLKVTCNGYKSIQKDNVIVNGGSVTQAGTIILEEYLFGDEIELSYDSGKATGSALMPNAHMVVKMNVDEKSILTGGSFLFSNDKTNNEDKNFKYVVFNSNNKNGEVGEILFGPATTKASINGDWTYVSFPEIKIKDDFYIGFYQDNGDSTLKIATDESSNNNSFYLHDNKWENYDLGSFMIRGFVKKLNEEINISELKINASSLNLNIGDKFDLDVVGFDQDNFEYNLTKNSSITSLDEKIVKVNTNGEVNAIGRGRTKIKISYKNKNDSIIEKLISVKVASKENENEIVKIIPSSSNISIEKNKTASLKIKSIDKAGKENDITNKTKYYFAKEDIISISNSGEIKTLNTGKTSVTANYKDPITNITHEAFFNVEVFESIANIIPSKKKISIAIDKKDSITINSIDSDGKTNDVTNKIVFDYKKPDIILIDTSGEITPKKIGSTIVTAEYKDSKTNKTFFTSFEVEVLSTKPISTIERIVSSKKDLTLEINETDKIEINSVDDLGFENSITNKVSFKVVDEKICSISSLGIISPHNEGATTINVTYNDGKKDFFTSLSITVNDNRVIKIIPSLSNISIQKGKNQIIEVYSLDNKNNKTNITSQTTSEFSNKEIVNINSLGIITALKKGNTTITFKYKEPISNVTFETKINVSVETKPIDNYIVEIKSSIKNIAIEKNNFEFIKIISIDNNNKENDVTNETIFENYNSSVISVSSSGKITALETGDTNILATYVDEKSISHTTNINVKIKKSPIKSIYPSQDIFTIKEEQEVSLSIFSKDGNSDEEDITKQSSFVHTNPGVINITSQGKITGVKTGRTILNISYIDSSSGKTFTTSIEVTVIKKDITKEIIKIEPDFDNIEMLQTDTKKITIYSVDDKGNKNDITNLVSFDVKNSSVCSLASNGSIKVLKEGTTKVNVAFKNTTTNKTLTTSFTIYIVSSSTTSNIKEITFLESNITLNVDETKELKVFSVDKFDNKEDITNNVLFMVDDKNICRVQSKKIVALSNGKTFITAKYIHNSKTFETKINITVNKNSDKSNIVKIIPSINYISLDIEDSQQIQIYSIDNKDNKVNITNDVSYQTKNGNIAISNASGVIKSFRYGETIITANYFINGKTFECNIKVSVSEIYNNFKTNEIDIVSIKTNIKEGDIYYLTVEAISADGKRKNITSSVSFVSDNKNIIKINDYGRIEAVKEGDAILKASYYDSSLNKTFDDKVSIHVSSSPTSNKPSSNSSGSSGGNSSSSNTNNSSSSENSSNNKNNSSNQNDEPPANNNTSSNKDTPDEIDSLNNIKLIEDKTFKYLSGYKDEDGNMNFKPNNKITRAEFSQVIYTLLDIKNKNDVEYELIFTDVTKNDWFYNQVKLLAKNNLISGYTDNTLKPNNFMTRAEAVTVLSHFVDDNYDEPKVFNDINNHWAYNNIVKLSSKGYINGYEDGSFNPNGQITRAELVVVVNNVLGRAPELGTYDESQNIYVDLEYSFWAYDHIISASKK